VRKWNLRAFVPKTYKRSLPVLASLGLFVHLHAGEKLLERTAGRVVT
jgi:hypothetical protein